MLGYAMRFLFS